MKNKTMKRAALLLTTLFLAVYPAAAQENITQINYTLGDNSMIKLISGDDWLVYTLDGVQGEFTKITPTGSAI